MLRAKDEQNLNIRTNISLGTQVIDYENTRMKDKEVDLSGTCENC